MNKGNRHAYLIMAHNQIQLLTLLLRALDHERVDIFLHLDKKFKCDKSIIRTNVVKSNLFFTKQIKVTWGGYSQIHAELILLGEAIRRGPYLYYHFITGVDLPLKRQDDILQYYDSCGDLQFIDMADKVSDAKLDRVRYYYFFQDGLFKRGSLLRRYLQPPIIQLQKMIGINRVRKAQVESGTGSAYFDITDAFARYVLTQVSFIKKYFSNTICGDEHFLQTIYKNSVFGGGRRSGNMRALAWEQGTAYTWRNEDFDRLMGTGCMFARKFNMEIDEEIVHRICREIGVQQ